MSAVIENILSNVTALVPEFLKNPEDQRVSNGGAAVCTIESDGTVLSVGYSGFRSSSDLEIVLGAVSMAEM